MTSVSPVPPPPSPEEAFVVQSAYEAAYLSDEERGEQRNMVGELIGDLASQGALDLEQRQRLLELFDENIAIARGESKPQEEGGVNKINRGDPPDNGSVDTQQKAMAEPTKTSHKQVKLPSLKQEVVERALRRAGIAIDTDGGKGHHVKIHDPETGRTTILSSKHGSVNPIPLGQILTKIGLSREDFIKHL